ncbi:hypothetical protein LIER_30245 [Lithospermum erythrorhizon]|uniref:Uncharacterized protein n=1 Tax=Lithospermum erythrorhizon TaxID=34254 RepID=A0AAV3RQ89_LITER
MLYLGDSHISWKKKTQVTVACSSIEVQYSLDCDFLRNAIVEGVIATSHVSTSQQLAGLFTKSISLSSSPRPTTYFHAPPYLQDEEVSFLRAFEPP